MMVVDSSALIAILLDEPGAESLGDRLYEENSAVVGAPTLLETGMVLLARNVHQAANRLESLLQLAGIEIASFTREHCELAQEAFRVFGKGRHPASLNFGDCMSYALAKSLGAPLLFKGEDFARTDMVSAL